MRRAMTGLQIIAPRLLAGQPCLVLVREGCQVGRRDLGIEQGERQLPEGTQHLFVVQVTTHRLCDEAPDEPAQVRRVWRRAVARARQEWGAEFTVETTRGECSPDARAADVSILETR